MTPIAQKPDTVMARKIAEAGQGKAQRARPLLRALRRGVAQAAMRVSGPAMAVIGATEHSLTHDRLASHLDDQRLLLILTDPDGVCAAICFDRAATTAVIRYQTIGTIGTLADDGRPFTDTDAAMLAPLSECLLSEAAKLMGETAESLYLQNFSFDGRKDDLPALLLSLGHERYRMCELVVDIGQGACQGQITLALPERTASPEAEDRTDPAAEAEGLERSFGVMRADLEAVLTRLQMPLADLSRLNPGDLMHLSNCLLEETELITIEGQTVALGRLGQCRGMRALRLNETQAEPLPELAAPDGDFDALSPQPGPIHANDALLVPDVLPSDTTDIRSDIPEPVPPDMQEQAAEISQLAGLPEVPVENSLDRSSRSD